MAVTNLYTLIKLFKTPVGTENELSSLPLSMIEIPSYSVIMLKEEIYLK